MPVLHVHVASDVLGVPLSFAWAVFGATLGDVGEEVARRAKRARGQQSESDVVLRGLGQRLLDTSHVHIVAEDGTRRRVTGSTTTLNAHSGEHIHFRTRRQARDAFKRRSIPSPVHAPPVSPISHAFTPHGVSVMKDISDDIWEEPGNIGKELFYEEESRADGADECVGYTDLWVEAWARVGSAAELLALLTQQHLDAIETLLEGGDMESLVGTNHDTAEGGSQSAASIGFRSGNNWNAQFGQLGYWDAVGIPSGLGRQQTIASSLQDPTDPPEETEANPPDTSEPGVGEDCLKMELIEHLFTRTWDDRAQPVKVTSSDIRRSNRAKMQMAFAAELPEHNTAWASLSPERRRDGSMSPGSPGSPILKHCDEVLDAEHEGDTEEASRAYKRLLASLRKMKTPSSASKPKRPHRTTPLENELGMEAVFRRNLHREESSGWAKLMKNSSKESQMIHTSARQRTWESSCLRKRWCMKGQWVVIAGETSRRNVIIYEQLEHGRLVYQMLRLQEMEMLRRVAHFSAWDREWRQFSVVLQEWRATLDQEVKDRIQREVDAKDMLLRAESDDQMVITDYEREMQIIEERKEALDAVLTQEEVTMQCEAEQDEWDARQDAWRRDRARLRLELLSYPATPYGVIQARRKIPYTGGDFTKARAEHHEARTSPTNRARSLSRHHTPQKVTASAGEVWPFEPHRRRLEDKLFT